MMIFVMNKNLFASKKYCIKKEYLLVVRIGYSYLHTIGYSYTSILINQLIVILSSIRLIRLLIASFEKNVSPNQLHSLYDS